MTLKSEGGAGVALSGETPELRGRGGRDFSPEEAVASSLAALARALEAGTRLDPARSALVDGAVALWVRPGFDTLVSLPRLRFEPFGYQLRAAERVLAHMRGRAILADEVGMGKTIEALLVASELRLRGLASRILVLAPPGVVQQWGEELDRKFALPWRVAKPGESLGSTDGNGPVLRRDQPIIVASIAAARRDPLRTEISREAWDLVIADEAHRLRNPQSASGRLARALRTRYLLLLTATPVSNRLSDVFKLVTLVQPGYLGTAQEFRSVSGRDITGLRTRLRGIMVRHRRSEVALDLPRRLAETLRVAPDPAEAAVYRGVSECVRMTGRDAPPRRALALRAVQRMAGSSPWALAPALTKAGWDDLARLASEIGETAKSRALVEVLRRAGGDKVIVFCSFLETLARLAAILAEGGIPAAIYHGSLTRRAKDDAVRAFRDEVPVLLTTEAAGEGRNLQFCHVMVNYDLPWNPMQIEQRLGRIHRIGQTRDVILTNLVTSGTIEDRILSVLEAKITLFELVIGELDMILGRVEDDFDFESAVFTAHVESRSDDELAERLEALGDDLASARTEYVKSRAETDRLVEADEE